jgi:hypothetical protein
MHSAHEEGTREENTWPLVALGMVVMVAVVSAGCGGAQSRQRHHHNRGSGRDQHPAIPRLLTMSW